MSSAILPTNADGVTSITAATLFPHELPPGGIATAAHYDLCRNAERVDCGATRPAPAALPLHGVPPGLHLIWEAEPLDGDTVPRRIDGSITYVIAAHPSWSGEDLHDARAFWSAVLADPQFKAADIQPALTEFASKLARPKKP